MVGSRIGTGREWPLTRTARRRDFCERHELQPRRRRQNGSAPVRKGDRKIARLFKEEVALCAALIQRKHKRKTFKDVEKAVALLLKHTPDMDADTQHRVERGVQASKDQIARWKRRGVPSTGRPKRAELDEMLHRMFAIWEKQTGECPAMASEGNQSAFVKAAWSAKKAYEEESKKHPRKCPPLRWSLTKEGFRDRVNKQLPSYRRSSKRA